MQGSLALYRGLVYVGREERTARVRVHDLDGREVAPGFAFRDVRAGRSTAAGLAVDGDRQVWVADTPASRVRVFTIFGREVGGLGLDMEEPLAEGEEERDAPGIVRAPVDVAFEGDTDEGTLVVASAGERRHAVQVFAVGRGLRASLRPLGDPRQRFSGVRGVALLGRFLYVAEGGRKRVQVFRDLDFHFELAPPGALEPRAVAPLRDGRMVVACGGSPSALLLLDGAGRLLRVLAEEGFEAGEVHEPNDVVLEEGAADHDARVVVIDRDGERVQVFTLAGRCYGAFEERAG